MLIDRPWYELSTQPQLVRLSKGQKFTFSNIIINKASKSTIHQNTGNKNKYKSNKL